MEAPIFHCQFRTSAEKYVKLIVKSSANLLNCIYGLSRNPIYVFLILVHKEHRFHIAVTHRKMRMFIDDVNVHGFSSVIQDVQIL